MSEQRCRICGCTSLNACTTVSGPCYWVEADLCSAPGCAGKEYEAGRMKLSRETEVAMDMPVSVDTIVGQWIIIVTACQFALQFTPPEDLDGKSAEWLRRWTARMTEQLALTPQLRFILEAKFAERPGAEAAPNPESPIIIPPTWTKKV